MVEEKGLFLFCLFVVVMLAMMIADTGRQDK